MAKYRTFKRILRTVTHETIGATRFLLHEIAGTTLPKALHRCAKCGKPLKSKYTLCYQCHLKKRYLPPPPTAGRYY